MNKPAVHKGDGHRRRLRERFLASGLDGFHDYEVIELLLTLATPRKDCKTVAKAALGRFKTLQGVFEASPADLCEISGIGSKNAFGIRLIKEVCDRYLQKKLIDTDPIHNSKGLFDFLTHGLRDKGRECFVVIYLNAKNRVIDTETLFQGSLTSSSVYPREVVLAALRHNAAALIFAHNHPSGDPAPSEDDMVLTRQLVFACGVIGITVHEHLVIGNNQYYSFADHGIIADMKTEFMTVRGLGRHGAVEESQKRNA
jgi:DNA repair protein RadC